MFHQLIVYNLLQSIHGREAREVLICSNVTKKSYSFSLPITSLLGRESQQRPCRCHPLVVLPHSWQPHVHPTDVGSTRGFQLRHSYIQIRTGKDTFMVLTKTKIKERPVSCSAGCSLSSGRFPDVTDTNVGSAEHSSGSSFTVLQSTPNRGSSIRCCNKLKKTN